MVKNLYYLIVGLFCIISAVTHTLNGTTTILPVLDNPEMESSVRTTLTYVWHIIGVENLILGLALLIMAFYKNPAKVKFTAWLIIAILILRWITIATITMMHDSNPAKLLNTDTIAIVVIVVLLLLGTRVKNKASGVDIK
jgi:F0F1-type ATP synthase membrane subunit c/vacuolar-type H+-ATPase subunit K